MFLAHRLASSVDRHSERASCRLPRGGNSCFAIVPPFHTLAKVRFRVWSTELKLRCNVLED